MSVEAELRYLRDRIEIQDKVALYGLGQDLHQGDSDDRNVLEQWGELFASDAEIDCTAFGLKVFTLEEYAELMRGPGMKGGGMDATFKVWQHIEGHATVKIDGDTATSITPHLHTHNTWDNTTNTFAVGYWHDRWERHHNGWRIVHRRLQHLYLNTFQLASNAAFFQKA